MPVVTVIAPGAMGSGVAQRLSSNGCKILTSLEGRSAASVARAEAAGMQAADLAEIAGSDLILSIVPPGEAMALARQLAPFLAAAPRKAIFADCNAISPQTVLKVEQVIRAACAGFIDAGIIGGPPAPGGKAPTFYASGPDASAMTPLDAMGIPVKLLSGPVGAASGLKMSYAGITKGTTALVSAMMLAATRFGAADDLLAELAASQPNVLKAAKSGVPGMFPKAYRWVAEMEEIADFAGEDEATRQIYQGIAKLYARLASDFEGEQTEIADLSAFVAAI
jgi:3-hydroxyisobutyrate dehydrogenase-like beta-hydroxyacid dehydrogenase